MPTGSEEPREAGTAVEPALPVYEAEFVDDMSATDVLPVKSAGTPLTAEAQRLKENATASRTRSAYASQWGGKTTAGGRGRQGHGGFVGWCDSYGYDPYQCDAGMLANYVTHMVSLDRSPTTIDGALSAIRWHYLEAGQPEPDRSDASEVLKGYRAELAEADHNPHAVRRARILNPNEVRAVLRACDLANTPSAVLRDRAFFALSFRTGRRISEISALRIMDIVIDDEGVQYFIRKQKTDRTGQEARWQRLFRHRDPSLCPAVAIGEWIDHLATRGITSGPLVRRVTRHDRIGGEPGIAGRDAGDGRFTPRGALDLWRTGLLRAEINPSGVTTHTGRRSALTNGWKAGKPLLELTRQLGWKDGSAVPLRYIEDEEAASKDALDGIY